MPQTELFNLKDHVAIVTGAASGLGLAFTEVWPSTARAWSCSI